MSPLYPFHNSLLHLSILSEISTMGPECPDRYSYMINQVLSESLGHLLELHIDWCIRCYDVYWIRFVCQWNHSSQRGFISFTDRLSESHSYPKKVKKCIRYLFKFSRKLFHVVVMLEYSPRPIGYKCTFRFPGVVHQLTKPYTWRINKMHFCNTIISTIIPYINILWIKGVAMRAICVFSSLENIQGF